MNIAISFPVAIPPLPLNLHGAAIDAVGLFDELKFILTHSELLGNLARDGGEGDNSGNHGFMAVRASPADPLIIVNKKGGCQPP